MADWRLDWHGEEAKAAVRAGAAAGVRDAAEFVLGKAREVVPIEEGTLSRSGSVDVGADGDVPVAAVAFHGPYAVIQHERLDFRHDPGRTAKYLERPLRATRGQQTLLIADAIRRALG